MRFPVEEFAPIQTLGMCALWMWPISQRARNIIITVLYTRKRRRSAVIVDAFREVLEIILRFFFFFSACFKTQNKSAHSKTARSNKKLLHVFAVQLDYFFPSSLVHWSLTMRRKWKYVIKSLRVKRKSTSTTSFFSAFLNVWKMSQCAHEYVSCLSRAAEVNFHCGRYMSTALHVN